MSALTESISLARPRAAVRRGPSRGLDTLFRASAYGAALLAGAGNGTFKSVPHATDSFIKPTETIRPNADNRRCYAAAYALYRSLYTQLEGEFPKSAALVG